MADDRAKIQKQFLEAYDSYSDSIFRYCYLRVFSKDLAQDIVQETCVRVWNYLTEGKEIKNFRPFLFKVANNLIIDESRKKKATSLDYLKEKGLEPRLIVSENPMESFDFKMILEVIGTLDDKYRDAILLRYVDDLPVKEIAEILSESEDNISVRLHRGLKQLKDILAKKHG